MALRELVFVTGLSGSGKGSFTNAFEDLGYFCVDNLPLKLIPKLIEISQLSGSELDRLALVVDVREGEFLDDFKTLYRKLRKQNFRCIIIFLEASDEALVKRFSETRRPHPLASARPILQGIALERKRLQEIREFADIVLDTSNMSVHSLKKYVIDHFKKNGNDGSLCITIMSFGFKYGVPFQSDLVFDVRFLPNPNFVHKLKNKNGRDKRVISYMKSFPETVETVQRFSDLLFYLIPKYNREGKTYLTISIGCTGGRHRSVFVAEVLRRNLKRENYNVRLVHRDMTKD